MLCVLLHKLPSLWNLRSVREIREIPCHRTGRHQYHQGRQPFARLTQLFLFRLSDPSTAMSSATVTTTAKSNTYRVTIPADYQIYHSKSPSKPSQETRSSEPRTIGNAQVNNPPGWPVDRRRIPDYRPVNTSLDQESRRTFRNVAERAFIANMFRGVAFNAVSTSCWEIPSGNDSLRQRSRSKQGTAQVWRATVGKYYPNFFQVKIGGEW